MDFTLPAGATVLPSPTPDSGVWHPTVAEYTDKIGDTYQWSTRWHRKGRYPLEKDVRLQEAGYMHPHFALAWFGYPFRDISYWVGLVFTLGCIAWVVNGHYALYTVNAAAATSEEGALTVAAIAAFIGGTFFEIGSWLLYWESLNQRPDVYTGRQLQLQQQAQAAAAAADRTGSSGSGSVDGQCTMLGTAAAEGHKQQQQQQQQAVAVHHQHKLHPVGNACVHITQQLQPGTDQCLQPEAQQQQQHHHHHHHHHHQQQQQPLLSLQLGDLNPSGDQHNTSAGHNSSTTSMPATSCSTATTAPSSSNTLVQNTATARHRSSNNKSKPEPAASIYDNKQHSISMQDVEAPAAHPTPAQQHHWVWLGYRRRDLGFMAAFLQLIGATIFWVPCIFATPGVYPSESLTNYRVWDGVYWLLQVVGASFFIISAFMFMLEEQPRWYLPQPQRIGWHVGFWNLIGAIGFLLSGAFGMLAVPQGTYQVGGTAASTFWGSYAFLIGSYLQLLEVLNKHPDDIKWKLC